MSTNPLRQTTCTRNDSGLLFFSSQIYRNQTTKKTGHALSKRSTLHNASLHLHSYLNTITRVHLAGAEPSTKRSVTRTAASVEVLISFARKCRSPLHKVMRGYCRVSSSSSNIGVAEDTYMVSGVVHPPQLYHNILHVCSILPFVFYCPFICFTL